MNDLFVLFPDLPWFPNRTVAERVGAVRLKALQMHRRGRLAIAERQLAVKRRRQIFYAEPGIRRRR